MNKRILTLGLALIMISSGIPALANRNIESKVAMMEEDHILDLSNVETYNKNGTKMVPIREVAENHLGLEIKSTVAVIEKGEGKNIVKKETGVDVLSIVKLDVIDGKVVIEKTIED